MFGWVSRGGQCVGIQALVLTRIFHLLAFGVYIFLSCSLCFALWERGLINPCSALLHGGGSTQLGLLPFPSLLHTSAAGAHVQLIPSAGLDLHTQKPGVPGIESIGFAFSSDQWQLGMELICAVKMEVRPLVSSETY